MFQAFIQQWASVRASGQAGRPGWGPGLRAQPRLQGLGPGGPGQLN